MATFTINATPEKLEAVAMVFDERAHSDVESNLRDVREERDSANCLRTRFTLDATDTANLAFLIELASAFTLTER